MSTHIFEVLCHIVIVELLSFRDSVAQSEHGSHAEESGGSSDEGRLPTPKLKTMLAAQRTHHDRTTPATGNTFISHTCTVLL